MRKLAAFVMTLTLFAAVNAVAQDLPQPIQVVASILGLSDAQVQSLIEVITSRDAAVRPLQQQIQMRQQALAAALQGPTPDPVVVGTLLIEIRTVEQQIGGIASQAQKQFEQILTPDQLDRLQHIRAASQVCPVVPAFGATGLL